MTTQCPKCKAGHSDWEEIEDRLRREAVKWLSDIPKKKNKPEGEIDLEELERELHEGLEEEIEREVRDEKGKDVVFKRIW